MIEFYTLVFIMCAAIDNSCVRYEVDQKDREECLRNLGTLRERLPSGFFLHPRTKPGCLVERKRDNAYWRQDHSRWYSK